MKRISAAVFLFCICAFPMSAMAANSKDFYYGMGVYSLGVNDPNGSVDAAITTTPLVAGYLVPFSRDSRINAELIYLVGSTDASVNAVGQDIESYGIYTTYQTRFRISRKFKPWGGIGFAILNELFEKRHTIDSSGFLNERFSDRDETTTGLVLNANVGLEFGKDFDLELQGTFMKPFNEGSEHIGLNLVYLFGI